MNTAELFTEVWSNFTSAQEMQSTVSERYTKAYETYRGALPERKQLSDLPAERIMWQAFESIYPTVLALFTDNQKSPVTFDSDGPKNSKLAAAITKAVHIAALKANGAYRLYMEALKEILIAGNQAALVGFDKKTYSSEKYTFDASPLADVITCQQVLTMTGYNIESDLTIDEDNQTATGTMQGTRTLKYIVMALIDFKNFYIHPRAKDVETSPYTAYSEDLTIGEAIARGLPEDKLLKTNKEYADNNGGMNKQLIVLNDMSEQIDAPETGLSEYNNTITLYHHYWRGCFKGKEPKLYYIISSDAEILLHKEVDYCPIVFGGMSIVSGSPYSESLYDICGSVQTSKTRAMRAIQRSADGAAYGEYWFIGQQMNPAGKAAWANRGPGAAYDVKSANAIGKIPVNDVPNAMQLLNDEINEAAQATIQGSAGQAQALEENGQASGAAIALTQDKQELNENQIAATIAETFIKPMYKILMLVLQEMGNVIELDGVELPLSMIKSDLGLSIDIKSGYDRAKAATNVKQAYEAAHAAGTLPQNITPENQYNIYADYFRAATGQEDVSRYITAPDDMPQPSKAEQLIKAALTVAKIRGEIAATELAEAKVEDMKADAQKKYNDSLYDLAKIKEILENIELDKVNAVIEMEKLKLTATNDITVNAQNQEQIDNTTNSNNNNPASAA